jgi:hypothetical protein
MRQIAPFMPATKAPGLVVRGQRLAPLLFGGDQMVQVPTFGLRRRFHRSAEHCSAWFSKSEKDSRSIAPRSVPRSGVKPKASATEILNFFHGRRGKIVARSVNSSYNVENEILKLCQAPK